MSQENVEVAVQQFEHFNAQEFEPILDAWTQDVTLITHGSLTLAEREAVGKEAVARAFLDWFAQFGLDYQAEIDEIQDLGDRVLVVATDHTEGRRSGARVTRQFAYLFTLRDRMICRIEPRRLMVPPLIHAVVEPDEWAGGVRLELWIEVSDDGKLSCRNLQIHATEKTSVTGDILKGITLPSIMDEAVVRAGWQHDPETGQIKGATRDQIEKHYPEAVKRSTRGKPRSDGHLQRIVKRYRELRDEGDSSPIKTIADEEMSTRQAVRGWLKKAVAKEFLDESERLTQADGGRSRKGSGIGA